MSVTSLHNKTIRPGSLMSYSYYHSSRRPVAAARPIAKQPGLNQIWRRRIMVTVMVLAALIVLPIVRGGSLPMLSNTGGSAAEAGGVLPTASGNQCLGNKLDKFITVNISQQHLWACHNSKAVYDSPVITGMNKYESTKTPPGTYRITTKLTDLTLTGSDEAGSWSDPVKYWMPFLSNQFGSYGFHDANWRPKDEFGKIDPNSSNASHGCVELPLSTSAWIYDWAPVGTPVTITS